MILVTLGTQDKPFKRLVEAIEKQVEMGNIKDEVIVQTGCTEYESNKMRIVDYLPINEFEELSQKADFIITHGGVGSILEGIKMHKKIIATPRKQEYGEHVNNHQEQIVQNFGEEGYIIPLYDLENFNEVLEMVKTFEPKEYKWNNENFIHLMEQEIDKLLKE